METFHGPVLDEQHGVAEVALRHYGLACRELALGRDGRDGAELVLGHAGQEGARGDPVSIHEPTLRASAGSLAKKL